MGREARCVLEAIAHAWGFLVELTTDDKVRNLAVVVGVGVAIQSILTARSIARKKQSADMLFQSRGDEKLQGGYTQIVLHHNADDKDVSSLAEIENKSSTEATQVRFLLNHWELLSIGIQAGIYDEQMVKKSWYSVVTDTYTRASPFIVRSRQVDKKATLFQEFEWLAKRWLASPIIRHDEPRWYEFWK